MSATANAFWDLLKRIVALLEEVSNVVSFVFSPS